MKISVETITNWLNDALFTVMTVLVFLFNFNTNRLWGVSGNTLTNMAILIFIAWWALNILRNGVLRWNGIFTYAVCFVLLCFSSYIYSYSPEHTFSKIKTLAIVLIMAICIFQYIVSNGRLELVLNVYALSGTVMAVYILSKANPSEMDRFGEIIGDSNLVGITLALTATVALFLFCTNHNILALIEFACMGYVILLTGSRTALALLCVAILSILYQSAYTYQWNLKKIVVLSAVVFVGVIALWYAIMNVPVLYRALGIRIVSFIQISQGKKSVTNEHSTQTRVFLAQQAFNWFLSSPVWGHGINSFMYYRQHVLNGNLGFSHCNYTEILSGVGIVGFVSYYGIFFRGLRSTVGLVSEKAAKYKPLIITLIFDVFVGDIGLVVYYEKCTWILIAIIAGTIAVATDLNDMQVT